MSGAAATSSSGTTLRSSTRARTSSPTVRRARCARSRAPCRSCGPINVRATSRPSKRATAVVTQTSNVYFDPFDEDIKADPYALYARLRDDAPLYYNERHNFFAVSRFEDVERVLTDQD